MRWTRIVSGDGPVRAATLVRPLEEQWNTLQRSCIWSMFMSAAAQWGTVLHNTRHGVGWQRCEGTQQTSSTFSDNWKVLTRWEKDRLTVSVYRSTQSHDGWKTSVGAAERGSESSGEERVGGRVVEVQWDRNTLWCWCFVWHERLLTAPVDQELCQDSQVSSGIWKSATESGGEEGAKAPEAHPRCVTRVHYVSL